MRFPGKKVVVAGGTGGINLAIATAFAQEGAHVAVFSRRPPKLAAGSWPGSITGVVLSVMAVSPSAAPARSAAP